MDNHIQNTCSVTQFREDQHCARRHKVMFKDTFEFGQDRPSPLPSARIRSEQRPEGSLVLVCAGKVRPRARSDVQKASPAARKRGRCRIKTNACSF